MKEMIKKVREDKEGFTLAELLVVVAIIAVLVAIAIPVFSASLSKSQAATDEANIRSGYAVVQVKALDGSAGTDKTWYLNTDGAVTKEASGSFICLANSSDLGSTPNIAGQSGVTWNKGQHISYAIGTDGKVTIKPVS
ncbi:MAG: prepilin-type N-terminal cleavage/methylation domain-containing protein [Gordonibacter sp.]|nr:prepilin-type N-terminal cleavage/methylation domain-containing protein [Gordonibacter sp.]